MTRAITIIGFLAIALAIIGSNIWAHFHPEKLSPLGRLMTKLMSDRTNRIAFALIWWWIGWHFLYSNL